MKTLSLAQKTFLLFLIVSFFLACSKKNGPAPTSANTTPTITTLSINQGPYDTSVIITGSNFSGAPENDKVLFNGKEASVTTATTTQLTVTVPLGAGTGHVTVSVNNGEVVSGPVFTYQLSAVVTTIAGSGLQGSADGKGKAASFGGLWGIVLDGSGNLYVSDYANGLIRKITQDGTVSTLAGNSTRLSKDGKGSAASFGTPAGMAIDATGNLYVTDGNLIRKVTPDGTVSTICKINNANTDLTGIVLDASGGIYAADVAENVILKINADGTSQVFAGSGTKASTDGTGTAASFSGPVSLTIDAAGNFFVVDEVSDKIRKITPGGVVTTVAGSGTRGAVNGPGNLASFSDPTGVAVDAAGNLFIGDFNNNMIRKVAANGSVTTIAGSGVASSIDGAGVAATFNYPNDLIVDSSGSLYVADSYSVRKITFE